MIISKCPLRISLVGGSTDLLDFIDYYGKGAVISFPVSLYTYITISSDVFGYNKINGKYIINYSSREEVENIDDIKNDIAREVLKYFNCEKISCNFTSDIFSSGSGLASSSSYTIAFIKAISKFMNIKTSNFDICKMSLEIEKKFNKHVGLQDIYGCGIGSLKRIDFLKGKEEPKITFLSQQIFDNLNMYLIPTNISRSSTEILKNIDLKKREELLSFVDDLETSIKKEDKKAFFEIINEGWAKKKETSSLITNNSKILSLDLELKENKNVLAHKLCGAGNGGFFLVFTQTKENRRNYIPVSISENGAEVIKI